MLINNIHHFANLEPEKYPLTTRNIHVEFILTLAEYAKIDDKNTVKVKELVINPGCSLSDQRHMHRREHWYILSGSCKIEIEKDDIIQTNAGRDQTVLLTQNKTHVINVYDWHRAYNPYDEPCHILEVQYGKKCIEEDIERR